MPTPAPAMPPLPQDVEQFLTWMTDQKGFSPATISAYRTDLLQFEEWLHREQHSLARPGELEKYHFQDYSAHLFHEGQARSSIGRKLSALRSLFRYLMKMKKIDKNPAKLVRNPKRELRHPTALNVDQMFTLLDEASVESGGAAGLDGSRQAEQAVTDREHAGHTRDLALAELLYGSGLRISEALDLDVDDVDPASGFIRVIGKGSKERIAQIYACAGANRIKVEEMVAGDIGCTVKLKDVHTGNTLNGKGSENRFNFIKYPNSKYSRAIKPLNESDTEKMMVALNRMREEDPTWVIDQSKELRQTIVHGQGEFHLRTLKWRLENNEKLQIKFEEPRIPYRETITKAARADYRHKKQSGGAGQFGEVHLIVEPYYEGMPLPETYKFNGQEFKMNVKGTEEVPLEWGGKLVFVNSIVGGSIDARFMPAILKGIMSRMEQGPLTGSYARDVRVIVYDGKMHPVDSNEISFMLAGRNAFSEAFKNAGPKILEPIYDVEVFVPSDKMGDVMGDLQGRRAMIMGMSSEASYEKLSAKVPLKEMSSYSTALSSLTGGRASFIMKFASYELVPSDVQDKLIKEFEAKQAEE